MNFRLKKSILAGCLTLGVGLIASANCTKDCAQFDTILSDVTLADGNIARMCAKYGKEGDSYYQDIFAANPQSGEVAKFKIVAVEYYASTYCGGLCATAQLPQRAVMDPYQNPGNPFMEGQGNVGRECEMSSGN